MANLVQSLTLIASAVILLKLLKTVLLIRIKLKQRYTILEVKPLQSTQQSSYTTQQLFILIHGLAIQKSFRDKVVGNQKTYSFEIVSTKNDGIRYLLRINIEDTELIRRNLLSYLPGISVNEVSDYIPLNTSKSVNTITEFKLSNHFAYPLKNQRLLDEYDPIAYITGNMTKLSANDLISFQIVVEPLNKNAVRDIRRVSSLVHSNKDLVTNIRNTGAFSRFGLLLQVLFFPLGAFIFLASGGREGPLLNLWSDNKLKFSNPYQEELKKLIKDKLDQQMFNASLRLLIVGDSISEVNRRNRGFISSLASFGNSGYQSLIPALSIKINILYLINYFTFKYRILSLFANSALSASEVADIYHFPFTSTTKTEDLVKVHSK